MVVATATQVHWRQPGAGRDKPASATPQAAALASEILEPEGGPARCKLPASNNDSGPDLMTLRLDEAELRFLNDQHHAAMVTLRADGTPHVAQVGIALVTGPDGVQHLWASGTQKRVRTRHLRRDPRCTLFVFDPPPMRWLGLETTVTIIDGPDAPGLHPRLFRAVLGKAPG